MSKLQGGASAAGADNVVPRPGEQETPALLPSVFPNRRPIVPGAEGYEGEKLHKMFLSGDDNLTKGRSDSNASNLPLLVESTNPQSHKPTRPDNLDAENANLEQDEEDVDGGPTFEPFFTVIEDKSTGTQHHPHVYYVFSDDDPDLMTNAMLDALDAERQGSRERRANESEVSGESLGARERYVIIDMDSNGHNIVSAHSLASNWQVVSHSVTEAPSFGKSSQHQESGLMLRIEGQQGLSEDTGIATMPQDKDATNDELFESMNRLSNQFHEELQTLRKLAGSGQEGEVQGHTRGPET